MKLFGAALLSIAVAASNAFAACPTPVRSQQGAWLLVVSEAVRVRFEEKSGEYDIGLKISGIGEEFKRETVAANAETVVELSGIGSRGESVNVVFTAGTLFIREGNRLMMRSARGDLSCSSSGDKLKALKRELKEAGASFKSSQIATTPYEAFARQIGL